MTKKELELYVHIPFCVKKCAYCDFLSAPAGADERAAYVDALIREIRSKKENFREYRVSTVFLGGGTPSILEGEDTARIFDALFDSFDISRDAEITMEVNPGTVTEAKAISWKKSGINRLSIGLQSADNRELEMLGRIHTFEDFLDTWETVRRAGFENVNIDLISAIPGQTVKSWEQTLRAAAELNPEHLSAYSLIIEEGTPFFDRYGEESSVQAGGKESMEEKEWLPLPDEDAEREIYRMTGRILKEYGYHRYEISNYAKEGCECRHNLGYWERKEYLGLGLGASSLVGERRFHNTANLDKYMRIFSGSGYEPSDMPPGTDSGSEESDKADLAGRAVEEIEIMTEQDQMEEFMFLGLRKTEGISCREFRENFGKTAEEVYGSQIRRFLSLDLMEKEGDRLRLTERGLDVSNAVFVEFMLK